VPVDGATIDLKLPEGLHTSDPKTVSLGTLALGDEHPVTWHVTADAQSSATTLTYGATVTASNSDSATASRQIGLPAISSKFKYVGLGDSFSSGEGAVPDPILSPDYLRGTNVNGNRCHRSAYAYPKLLSGKHSMFPADVSFHACSGALIEDLYAPFASNHDGKNYLETHKQLDWLDASTDVVTLSLGGNNAQFEPLMDYCAKRMIFMASCKSVWSGAVTSAIRNLSVGTTAGTHDNLPDAYRAIRAKAPHAKVYVLGYPRFFPKKPPQSCRTGVPAPTAPLSQFTQSDMRWINDETKVLNGVISRSARSAGFIYVDTYDAFDGHELCSGLTTTKWMNRVVLPDDHQSYHPNVLGHQAFTRALVRASGSPS
jgi:lysophospholipase L1-like esterase